MPWRKTVKIHHSLTVIAGLLLAASSFAAGLTVGSPAPTLEVTKWYKGEPVTAFDHSKTYVVEFWATWCGPCRESIPHLTELQKKHADVTFIGVSVEADEKDVETVKSFVE